MSMTSWNTVFCSAKSPNTQKQTSRGADVQGCRRGRQSEWRRLHLHVSNCTGSMIKSSRFVARDLQHTGPVSTVCLNVSWKHWNSLYSVHVLHVLMLHSGTAKEGFCDDRRQDTCGRPHQRFHFFSSPARGKRYRRCREDMLPWSFQQSRVTSLLFSVQTFFLKLTSFWRVSRENLKWHRTLELQWLVDSLVGTYFDNWVNVSFKFLSENAKFFMVPASQMWSFTVSLYNIRL